MLQGSDGYEIVIMIMDYDYELPAGHLGNWFLFTFCHFTQLPRIITVGDCFLRAKHWFKPEVNVIVCCILLSSVCCIHDHTEMQSVSNHSSKLYSGAWL